MNCRNGVKARIIIISFTVIFIFTNYQFSKVLYLTITYQLKVRIVIIFLKLMRRSISSDTRYGIVVAIVSSTFQGSQMSKFPQKTLNQKNMRRIYNSRLLAIIMLRILITIFSTVFTILEISIHLPFLCILITNISQKCR